MKSLFVLLAAGILAAPLTALEVSEVSAVAGKFVGASPEDQYAARVELDQLIHSATCPEKTDRAAVTKALVAVAAAADTPAEAKKYLLRALEKTGTADAVPALAGLLNGPDAFLAEEARLALERIPGESAVGALESAFARASGKREKMSLANSLAVRKAVSALPAIAALVGDADLEIARAGIAALAGIGGPGGVEALKKAHSSEEIAAGLKPDIEKALLIAAGDDSAAAMKIFAATTCPAVRLAAFNVATAGELTAEKETLLLSALKSGDILLRQNALRCGLRKNLASLQQMLAQSADGLSLEERLVVLGSIESLKPADAAEKFVLGCIASGEEDEKAAALVALGKFDSKTAFETVLKHLSAREQAVSKAAGEALALMPHPGAGAELLEMLKGGSSEDGILAIKALAFRHVDGAGEALLDIVKSDDEGAAREALKTLYVIAGEKELDSLARIARAASDPAEKKLLVSVCARIAERLGAAEAQALVKDLQENQ